LLLLARFGLRGGEVVAMTLDDLAGADVVSVPPAILLQWPWLAGTTVAAAGIGYTMADNAFIRIDDWARAQQLADALSPDQLHRILYHYAGLCCPVCDVYGQRPTTGA
jgi:hypothetical protein